MLQKNIPYGPLWSDEGVYKIAKEIQLLRPQEFDIFFGLRGFHMEKVVLASLGSFLKESNAKNVLAETEVFGPVVTESVLDRGHYVPAKRGKSFVIRGFVTNKN